MSKKVYIAALVAAALVSSFGTFFYLRFLMDTAFGGNYEQSRCQGAQKRVEDTFKVMDACQQMLGCTITVDDLRKAQEQLNQAESCK